MTAIRSKTPHLSLQALTGLFITLAACTFTACSNSEYVAADEFGIPVSDYTFEEGSQDTAYIKDFFTDFPPSGFYPNPFTILLPENKPQNCEIGGFVPTKDSPLKTEIKIDSTSTIRCINFSDDSNTETIRTYIFEKKPTIPTIFITTDPNSLFDPDTGIYMKGPNAEEEAPHYGANYWLDKELPIFIDLTESDSYIPAFSKYAGLKIFGNYSRMYAKKSVAITFREKYGNKRLNYELFPDFPNLNRFKGFILRNFGTSFGRDYIRDRLASSISEGLGVDYQRGRYVVVYYNGKYFGIHDLRERSNEYYFETHYGIKHNNIDLLKASNSASAGSSTDYTALISWLENHNLENEENYNYISSKIDIDNFINYMQVEIFAHNGDWPGNNLKKWKQINPETPWKWFLYDIDWGFGEKHVASNTFEFLSSEGETNHANDPKHTYLFRSLLTNEDFRTAFVNRMTSLLQMNFESSRILAQIQKMMAEIATEIPRDQKRWSLNATKMDEQLEAIKRFAAERQSYIISHLQGYFNLGKTVPITLSIKGNGKILVHNLPLDKAAATIQFFEGLPVTIMAEPENGSLWFGWSDGDTNTTRTIYPEKAVHITAIFN